VTLPGSAATASGAGDRSRTANSPTESRKALCLNMFMFILPFSLN
jgi:hypothetical protein